jgi:hypothetical protein
VKSVGGLPGKFSVHNAAPGITRNRAIGSYKRPRTGLGIYLRNKQKNDVTERARNTSKRVRTILILIVRKVICWFVYVDVVNDSEDRGTI